MKSSICGTRSHDRRKYPHDVTVEKINEVAREILEFGIGVFPVIDEGKHTGIVTEFDLVKGLDGNM